MPRGVREMERRGRMSERTPSLGEALRGLLAFLLLMGTTLGLAAALLHVGERPGPPPSWPGWEDVQQALWATEPPIEAARYVASMAGWLALTYVAVVLFLRAIADTLVSLTRGVTWAQELSGLVDIITLPWVKRGISGGLLAVALVASLVKASPELPRPELPRLSFDGGVSRGEGYGAKTVSLEETAPARTTGGEALMTKAQLVQKEEAPVETGLRLTARPAEEAPSSSQSQSGATPTYAQLRSEERPELPPPVTGREGESSELPAAATDGPRRKMVLPGVRLPAAVDPRGTSEVPNIEEGQ
jgi:hypothetical protein